MCATLLLFPPVDDPRPLLHEIPLTEGLAGRHPRCALRFPDPSVMLEHARFLYQHGSWYVGPAAVISPTVVNGVRVELGEAVRLFPGDTIRLGRTMLVVDGTPHRPGVPLSEDPAAVQVLLDELLEAGDPSAADLARGAFPDHFTPLMAGSQLDLRHGLPLAMTLDGSLLHEQPWGADLPALLAHPVTRGLERLTVYWDTAASRGAGPAARAAVHAIAWARPPRLGSLRLEVDHPALDLLARELGGDRVTLGQRLSVTVELAGVARAPPERPSRRALVEGLLADVRARHARSPRPARDELLRWARGPGLPSPTEAG